MRKILVSIVVICAIIIGGIFYAVPSFINSQVTAKIHQKFKSDDFQAKIQTSPDFMLLFGQIDELNLSANNIELDKVNLNTLTITGQDIDFSVEDLILARRLVVNSAETLTITGTMDESNLAKLLNEKIDNVSDITVSINPDSIDANGKISLLGRASDVHVRGYFLLQDNNLIFRITDADTTNNLFGKISINLTKDIIISNTTSLPIENTQFTKVEQQNGQVLIEASVNK